MPLSTPLVPLGMPFGAFGHAIDASGHALSEGWSGMCVRASHCKIAKIDFPRMVSGEFNMAIYHANDIRSVI